MLRVCYGDVHGQGLQFHWYWHPVCHSFNAFHFAVSQFEFLHFFFPHLANQICFHIFVFLYCSFQLSTWHGIDFRSTFFFIHHIYYLYVWLKCICALWVCMYHMSHVCDERSDLQHILYICLAQALCAWMCLSVASASPSLFERSAHAAMSLAETSEVICYSHASRM